MTQRNELLKQLGVQDTDPAGLEQALRVLQDHARSALRAQAPGESVPRLPSELPPGVLAPDMCLPQTCACPRHVSTT